MDIERLATLEDDALFELAGRELARNAMGIGEPDEETLRARGRRWVQDNRKELAQKLCGTYLVKYVRSPGKEWDRVLLLAAVADLLSSASWGLGPTTAAALVLRVGLTGLCDDCAN